MRIGISAFYRMHGGSLTHLRHILKIWADEGVDREHEIVLFLREDSVEQLRSSLSPRMRVVTVGGTKFGPMKKLLWEQFRFSSVLRRERIDVLFCTGNLVPMFTRTPTVLALRNAGPFCESMTLHNVGFSLWSWMKVLGVIMYAGATRATRVIFISQYFRNIMKSKGFDVGRGDVIYHGRDAREINVETAAPPPPGRFLLYVGNMYRYKNVAELIEAFALEREFFDRRQIRLAIVGKPIDAAYDASLRALVARHGLEQSIVFTGGVTHAEIQSWMGVCEAFVFQSTCENCPNTLIEAMAAGLAIACSNAGVMPEIAGNAAEYFDPFDPRDIARAMRRVVEDAPYATLLRARALEESLRFPTWREVGQATLQTLQRAAS